MIINTNRRQFDNMILSKEIQLLPNAGQSFGLPSYGKLVCRTRHKIPPIQQASNPIGSDLLTFCSSFYFWLKNCFASLFYSKHFPGLCSLWSFVFLNILQMQYRCSKATQHTSVSQRIGACSLLSLKTKYGDLQNRALPLSYGRKERATTVACVVMVFVIRPGQ